jgi:hypothetical protein
MLIREAIVTPEHRGFGRLGGRGLEEGKSEIRHDGT